MIACNYRTVPNDIRDAGDPDEADHPHTAVLTSGPDCIVAMFEMAQSARLRGDREASLEWHRQAATQAPDNPWPHLQAAFDLQSLGRFDAAERSYEHVLRLLPQQAEALLGLGQCARVRGDLASALALHQAAAAASPSSLAVYLEMATDLVALDRIEEAESAYEAALAMAPLDRQALLGLAHCARLRGDRHASLAHHRAAAGVTPPDPWSQLQAGFDLQVLARFEEAEHAYRAVLALVPGQTQALLGLGQCARQRGDWPGALAAHRSAVATAEEDAGGHLELALDLQVLGRPNEAACEYRAILARDPGNVRALIGAGQTARSIGDRACSLDYLERAASRPDAGIEPLLELAHELCEFGRLDDARAAAREAFRRGPEDHRVAMRLGAIERYADCHDVALAFFEQAHRLQPALAEPLVEMSIELRALGRLRECDRMLLDAIALEPGNMLVLMQLAFQAQLARRPRQALDHLGKAAQLQPFNFELMLAAIEPLIACEGIDQAFARLDELEARHGSEPSIRLRRLDLLHRTGRWDEALPLARLLTADHTQNARAWLQRAQIELVAGTDASLEECLQNCPARTTRERSWLFLLKGLAAEARADLGSALRYLREADILDPQGSECQIHLFRLSLLVFDLETARHHLRRLAALNATSMRLQGRSVNPSQTLFGQLLDEYQLDAEVAAHLRPSSRGSRLPEIVRLVADNPDSTAAAVGLICALPTTDPESGPRGESLIPTTIVQFWDKPEMPKDIEAMMQSWRALHPSYRFVRFDERSALAFLRAALSPDASHAFRRAREPAQKADLFRLAYLAVHGGIYVDADDRCIGLLDAIIAPRDDLVIYREELGSIGNNFIAAVPAHPVIVRALDLAMRAMIRGDDDIVWLSTGPGLLTRALAQVVAERDPDDPLGRIRVLHRRDLFRTVAIHCLTGYKSADRHWSSNLLAVRAGQKAAGQTEAAAR